MHTQHVRICGHKYVLFSFRFCYTWRAIRPPPLTSSLPVIITVSIPPTRFEQSLTAYTSGRRGFETSRSVQPQYFRALIATPRFRLTWSFIQGDSEGFMSDSVLGAPRGTRSPSPAPSASSGNLPEPLVVW